MKIRDFLLIFFSGLLIFGVFAYFQSAPGYMDAEYYYAMGLRIARDKTFSEPFVWNYLNGFNGLPVSGFSFWMPLPALFAALSMKISGWYSFFGARIGFIILAGLVPILSAKITYSLTAEKRFSILAGLFAIFPVFYSPFLTTTDGFGIVMLIGAGFFLIAQMDGFNQKFLILGFLVGLMHLTRTDGFLWMIIGIYIVASEEENKGKPLVNLLLGYFLVLGPWFVKNWILQGNIFPPASSKMLWLTSYDDLFIFDAELIDWTNWLKQGFKELAGTRLSAVITNLKTTIVVQWQIILLPLTLIGLIKNRKSNIVQAFVLTWVLVFGLMSIVFPFAGTRGGFFHSGAAFQPFFWAMAAIGLSALIDWGKVNRGWKSEQALFILGTGFVLLLASMTIFVLKTRVIGDNLENIQWNQSFYTAVDVGKTLNEIGAPQIAIVMINNPPGLYIATERTAVVIPNGDTEQLYQAVMSTGASYLVLEKNHTEQLNGLYLNPDQYSKFGYITTEAETHYFKIP